MKTNKSFIRKTNINGEVVDIPIKKTPVRLTAEVSMSDLLTLGKSVAFTELTRIIAISSTRGLTPEETWQYEKYIKSVLELKKLEISELKDLNLAELTNKDLFEIARKHVPELSLLAKEAQAEDEEEELIPRKSDEKSS